MYERVLAIDAKSIGGLLQLGLLHNKQGRLAEAQAMFERLLAVDPKHTDGLLLLRQLRDRQVHFVRHEERVIDKKGVVFYVLSYRGREFSKRFSDFDRLRRDLIANGFPNAKSCGAKLPGKLFNNVGAPAFHRSWVHS